MKFTCPLPALKKALTRLSFLPGGNVADLISGNLYIEAGLDGLQMKRRSTAATLVCGWDAEIAVEGEIVIPFEKFRRFIETASGDEAAFRAGGGFLHVTAGGNAKLAEIQDAAFTEMECAGENVMQEPAARWADWLGVILPARATAERAKPLLEGIIVRTVSGCIWLACADGRRFHLITTQYPLQIDRVIPPETATALLALAKGEENETPVTLTFSENNLAFATPEFRMVSVLMEGTVGDFTSQVLQPTEPLVCIDKDAAIAAARAASTFVNSQLDPIILNVKPGAVTFTSGDSTGSGFTREVVATDGHPFELAFNWDYFTDAIAACRGPSVSLAHIGIYCIVMREEDRIIAVCAVRNKPAAAK